MVDVTDEMVERAWSAGHKKRIFETNHDMVRAMLEAALNPPEPEVVVTAPMRKSGLDVLLGTLVTFSCDPEKGTIGPLVENIYRAMRRLEPKPEREERRSGKERRAELFGFVTMRKCRSSCEKLRSSDGRRSTDARK